MVFLLRTRHDQRNMRHGYGQTALELWMLRPVGSILAFLTMKVLLDGNHEP